MMGHHARSEALFYYFHLEDQIPANHLLRLIDKHVSFAFVRQQLKNSYSETGHTGPHAPQSMHSSGSMCSMFESAKFGSSFVG